MHELDNPVDRYIGVVHIIHTCVSVSQSVSLSVCLSVCLSVNQAMGID